MVTNQDLSTFCSEIARTAGQFVSAGMPAGQDMAADMSRLVFGF